MDGCAPLPDGEFQGRHCLSACPRGPAPGCLLWLPAGFQATGDNHCSRCPAVKCGTPPCCHSHLLCAPHQGSAMSAGSRHTVRILQSWLGFLTLKQFQFTSPFCCFLKTISMSQSFNYHPSYPKLPSLLRLSWDIPESGINCGETGVLDTADKVISV